MKENQASDTAERLALARAYETRRPPDVRICNDPLAARFLGKKHSRVFNNRILLRILTFINQRRRPGLLYFCMSRCRYIDDYLQSCIDNGLEQLVILGAGYDTRAYRFDGLKDGVKVFELDHPATQEEKVKKLKEIFNRVSDHVTFIPVDFVRESFQEKLFHHGYDRELKTLFIWEGVVSYITAEAVNSTLAFIAQNSGKGSSVIFDYVPVDVLNGTVRDPKAKHFTEWIKSTGEPFQFGIDPEMVEQFLLDRGFLDVQSIDGKDLKGMYFHGINEALIVSKFIRMASATVASGA